MTACKRGDAETAETASTALVVVRWDRRKADWHNCVRLTRRWLYACQPKALYFVGYLAIFSSHIHNVIYIKGVVQPLIMFTKWRRIISHPTDPLVLPCHRFPGPWVSALPSPPTTYHLYYCHFLMWQRDNWHLVGTRDWIWLLLFTPYIYATIHMETIHAGINRFSIAISKLSHHP